MTLQWLSLAAIQSFQSRASYRFGKQQKQTCHQFSVNPFSFESKQSRAFPARVINSHNCGFRVSFVSARVSYSIQAIGEKDPIDT